MVQANQHMARTKSFWIWPLKSVHGHSLPPTGYLSVHYILHSPGFIVLTVLCIQVHYVLCPPGVVSLKSMELRAEDVIVHLVVIIHLGDIR